MNKKKLLLQIMNKEKENLKGKRMKLLIIISKYLQKKMQIQQIMLIMRQQKKITKKI